MNSGYILCSCDSNEACFKTNEDGNLSLFKNQGNLPPLKMRKDCNLCLHEMKTGCTLSSYQKKKGCNGCNLSSFLLQEMLQYFFIFV